ncbi:MAG: hypothetical protein AAGF84_04830 [Planctomycetota bacterium]
MADEAGPTQAPSAWRVLWSPSAMAWHAIYRPHWSLRLGTFAFAIWWGANLGWFLVMGDRWGAPSAGLIQECVVVFVVSLVALHGWTWVANADQAPAPTSPRAALWRTTAGSPVFRVWMLASIPACIIDFPDTLLSIYRDAVHYDSFSNTPSGWPPLPVAIQASTQSCMWFFTAIAAWLVCGLAGAADLRRRVDETTHEKTGGR